MLHLALCMSVRSVCMCTCEYGGCHEDLYEPALPHLVESLLVAVGRGGPPQKPTRGPGHDAAKSLLLLGLTKDRTNGANGARNPGAFSGCICSEMKLPVGRVSQLQIKFIHQI